MSMKQLVYWCKSRDAPKSWQKHIKIGIPRSILIKSIYLCLSSLLWLSLGTMVYTRRETSENLAHLMNEIYTSLSTLQVKKICVKKSTFHPW